VINVSWNDAHAYVAWLSRKTGKTYRLLSEAEREYVTRAETSTAFWWGTSVSTNQANYDGRFGYEGGPSGQYRERTMPVDSFQPNPWGLYQIHGNVWEWTEDCYQENYNGVPQDGAPRTGGDCPTRVVRGGSWASAPLLLRSANRGGDAPGSRGLDLGFRVARTLTP
jgi:formylglycine-generating enzyme required for sulfatase activity